MKNNSIQKYLSELSPTQHTDYSLWGATRNLNRPKVRIPPLRTAGNWARSNSDKCSAFATHFAKICQPFSSGASDIQENEILL